MLDISVFRGSNVTARAARAAALCIALCLGGGGAAAAAQPRPDVSLALRDGRFLHLVPLPFGTLAAAVVGPALFDTTGTRVALLAEFPGAGIHGDWRSADPVQAYLVDAARLTLTQLTTQGRATAVRWNGDAALAVSEDHHPGAAVPIVAAARGGGPPGRMLAGDAVPSGSARVSQESSDRLAVYKTSDGRYAVVQIGAKRFRIAGTARDGSYAIIGAYLAWIDGQRHIARQIARSGPDNAEPLSFAGSPYGDALAPIVPLGSSVYQSAYRNGVVYFTFSHGVERIVAASNDLVNYWFPALPHAPVFTIGDGFGAAPDGAFYFIRPEEDTMLFTRAGKYVRTTMSGLDAGRDESAMVAAMRRLAGVSSGIAMQPSADALDAAMFQWRFYPVGDAAGERWIGSRFGRVLIGDAQGRFAPGRQPAFPFVVLGRSDDGRIWGAAPTSRSLLRDDIVAASSSVWWTRDGSTWRFEASLAGDVGAIGTHGTEVWAALTRPWLRLPMVWLARIDDVAPRLSPTGGTYAGEQLAFAGLSNGFYLLWGATPGRRLGGDGGPLCGYRIDADALAARDAAGDDVFIAQRLLPDDDPSLPGPGERQSGASALLGPTFAMGRSLPRGGRLTLASNIALDGTVPDGVTVMGLEQERAFELKYAGRPYPLATVAADIHDDRATVTRSFQYGPLHASGGIERWNRDAGGAWHLVSSESRYSF
jgi:hypothetical protein